MIANRIAADTADWCWLEASYLLQICVRALGTELRRWRGGGRRRRRPLQCPCQHDQGHQRQKPGNAGRSRERSNCPRSCDFVGGWCALSQKDSPKADRIQGRTIVPV
jgi:hypothetical protein